MQMQRACRLPVALADALMADAQVAYGLPIGGVPASPPASFPLTLRPVVPIPNREQSAAIPRSGLRPRPGGIETPLRRGLWSQCARKSESSLPTPCGLRTVDCGLWTVDRGPWTAAPPLHRPSR